MLESPKVQSESGWPWARSFLGPVKGLCWLPTFDRVNVGTGGEYLGTAVYQVAESVFFSFPTSAHKFSQLVFQAIKI